MVTKYFIPLFLLASFGGAFAKSCANPKVEATFFTTLDATIVTEIAYITEFTLQCDEPLPASYSLYAEVDGKTLSAARIGENKFQISWTEEVSKARSGLFEIRVLDYDGYTTLRRLRESNPDATVSPLLSIQLNHPGFYTGPWVNSEVLATLVSILVAYVAIHHKNKILA